MSLSAVYTAADGFPAIGFDTYTVQQLAELVEPALRRVTVRLGPNSLALLERGETVGLSGGEYADLAREAAHAIVHRNDPAPAVPAGQAPATDQAAEPVCKFDEGCHRVIPCETGCGASVDWAVVAYRSPGTRTLYCVVCARQESGWQPLTADKVREGAVCDFCGGRVLAVASRTLGDVVARYAPSALLAVLPPTDRAALRDRIAAAIDRVFEAWREGLGDRRPQDALTDEVLAVLPASVDRATVLREAADAVRDGDLGPRGGMSRDYENGWWNSRAAAEDRVRRMADEAPQPGHVYLSTGCLHGEHAYCSNVDGIAGLKKPAQCKFCAAPCVCPCHAAVGAQQPKENRL